MDTLPGTSLESLMDTLGSQDGMLRQKAREELVKPGVPAVLPLVHALQASASDQVRWEAAKALGAIGNASAIPALVNALADSNSDVAWLAAVALSKFKKAAWPALLSALIKDEKSYGLLRQGAHHVLVEQKEHGFNDSLAALVQALDANGVPEAAVSAAAQILKRMKEGR